jgi:hypothetical protein
MKQTVFGLTSILNLGTLEYEKKKSHEFFIRVNQTLLLNDLIFHPATKEFLISKK